MPLASGTKLGPYEIVAPLGAGGMGEVYRARDSRLHRDVAVKVLPVAFSEDADRLHRFKQEAQAAAALNHPSLLTIYHVGEHEGAPYIVSELLDGETLRQRLEGGPLAVRRVIDYALQLARGLAAAHDKGIVHRDLKPENIYITRDGRTKILDFGLAKLIHPNDGSSDQNLRTLTAASEPGTVLGTVGYMSPEQVRGQTVGPTSDLFSFGAILYEMLTGKRAFRADTSADTMSAILKEEPPEMSETNRQIPPALERIVRHCLEKGPEERFQSARDVAFNLEALSSVSGTASIATQSDGPHRSWSWAKTALGVLSLLLVAAGGYYLGRQSHTKPPIYRRLTFRQGSIQAARFMSDGQSVIYSGSFEGNASEIFTTRPQGPESRAMGLTGSSLLAVSPQGEVAILQHSHAVQIEIRAGTLARVPLDGGVPREILANIENADWSPDGFTLLITRQVAGIDRLESPPGKVIFQNTGAVGHARFSPQGDRIAFFDYPVRLNDNGSVAVVDLAGHETILSKDWTDLTGLAWSPDGKEVWFTGTRDSGTAKLFAVTLTGNERELYRNVGDLRLFDVARDGRMLLSREDWRSGIYGLAPGGDHERDLSWFDYSVATDLSADGRMVLFQENGESGALQGTSYLRGTEGSPALRISEYPCWSFSRDGETAICTNSESQITQVPIKTGEVKTLTNDELRHGIAVWFPDQKHILFQGTEPGHSSRLYAQDIAEGKPRAVTPQGDSTYFRISPDGEQIAVAVGSEYRTNIFAASGGEGRPVKGLEAGEVPVGWSSDGKFLYCQKLGSEIPFGIVRIDLASGLRALWKQITPPDPVGITFIEPVFLSSDLKSYAYSVDRRLDVLYFVNELH